MRRILHHGFTHHLRKWQSAERLRRKGRCSTYLESRKLQGHHFGMAKALKCADVTLKYSHPLSFLFPGMKPQTNFHLEYRNEGGTSQHRIPLQMPKMDLRFKKIQFYYCCLIIFLSARLGSLLWEFPGTLSGSASVLLTSLADLACENPCTGILVWMRRSPLHQISSA